MKLLIIFSLVVLHNYATSEPALDLNQFDFQSTISSRSEFDVFAEKLLSLLEAHHIAKRSIQDYLSSNATLDVPEILTNLILSYQFDRFEKLRSGVEDAEKTIEDLVKLVNVEVGGEILVPSNDVVTLNASEIARVLQNQAVKYIKQEFKDNLFLQLALTSALQTEVKKQTPALQSFFDNVQIPLGDAKKIMAASFTSSVTRSKRSLAGDLYSLVQSLLQTLLDPVKTISGNLINSIINTLLGLYTSDQPTDVVSQILFALVNTVIEFVVELLTNFRSTVNNVIDALTGENSTSTTSRRKRELLDEFSPDVNLYELPEREHRIVKRDISSIVSVIFNVIFFIPNLIIFGIQAFFLIYKIISTAMWILSFFS